MPLPGHHYVRYINITWRRTGTRREGRYKAGIVHADEYSLSCWRYIELNPVRAGLVSVPDDCPWSSYCCHSWGEAIALIQDHPLYLKPGHTNQARSYAYRELLNTEPADQSLHAIRPASHYNHPLGNDRFKKKIEAAINRRAGRAKRGRPKHSTGETQSLRPHDY